ncbi:MAG: hypothetical protein DMG57_24215 [Acidobacteria bacterium]|nr:MAG: hypothetical protein DMG57_24215 [Acidobacteriota bacterium]
MQKTMNRDAAPALRRAVRELLRRALAANILFQIGKTLDEEDRRDDGGIELSSRTASLSYVSGALHPDPKHPFDSKALWEIPICLSEGLAGRAEPLKAHMDVG